MRRNKINHIAIIPTNVTAQPGGSINVSMTREYAEPDTNDPTGEAVYSRDTLDAQISDPTIVAEARALADRIAQHLADELAIAVKLDPRRDAPLAMPKGEATTPAIVR